MAMQRYAEFRVLSAKIHRQGAQKLTVTGHRHEFNYTPRPGYLYVRSRMISSRTNDNYDTFPPEEIKAAWPTFVGKPVFINHHNEDPSRARGVIVDAALHEDTNPDGTPDTWVEGLMEVDAIRFPRLAERVISGEIDRTSMGTNVAYSKCSYCGNKAETPLEYCQHIASMKGQRITRTTASGVKEAVLVSEICYGLGFFENSLLVEQPADPTAYTFGVDTRGLQTAASVPAAPRVTREPIMAQNAAQPRGDLARTAALETEAAGPKYPNAADHPFYKANPPHPDHIVEHWNRATPEEIGQGKSWYHDAHTVAKALGMAHFHAKHEREEDARIAAAPEGAKPERKPFVATDEAKKRAPHVGAGVLAAYSPQTAWPANMHNAARALDTGVAIGGKGSGVMATGVMKTQAQRILDGEKHTDVLKSPKISHFAHLIEHGGNKDNDDPHTVIDRHALSVAIGRRVTDDDLAKAPLDHPHYYGHVVKAYHEAAKQISAKTGETVQPHQVQAATWLVRQRENAQADAASTGGAGKGRNRSQQRNHERWEEYAREHHPDLVKGTPGWHVQRSAFLRRLAYGEQVAPPEVNTLRPEDCPICGDQETFDGAACQVCGYIAPPEQFQDPDLDLAQETDLHQTEPLSDDAMGGGEGELPPDLEQDPEGPPLEQADPNAGEYDPMTGEEPADDADQGDEDDPDDLDEEDDEDDEDEEDPTKRRKRVAGMATNKAAAERNRLRTALAAQQKQITSLTEVLAYVVDVAGLADDPKVARVTLDVTAKPKQAPAKSAAYTAGYRQGKADRASGANLTLPKKVAEWSDAEPEWQDGWTEGYQEADGDTGTVASKTAADEEQEPVATSSEEALQPDATDDPQNYGAVPAPANADVTSDATTDPQSTDVAIPQAPYNQLVDVTEQNDLIPPPPGPPSHVQQDITSGPAAPRLDPAYPMPGDGGWTASKNGDDAQTRFMASLRLAKLRVQAGIGDGDEMALTQSIVDSPATLGEIGVETGTLEAVLHRQATAAQPAAGARNLVPRAASAAPTRAVPSLTGSAESRRVQGAVGAAPSAEEFGDL